MPTKLTPEIITAAIAGFETRKTKIDGQIAELRQALSGGSAESAAIPEAPTRKRKKFSAASRRKMALAQKARWAKIKGESGPTPPATTKLAKPKRRKMSAAGRAAIIAATKKRWAQKRAEAAKTQPAKETGRKATVKKAAAKAPPKKVAKKSAPVKNNAVKKAPSESAA
jgi:DNA-binding protein HU-beta